MKIAADVTRLIGNTPLIRLNRLVGPEMAEVCLKLESFNPGGSVKDRPALSMVEAAEAAGLLGAGSIIVEPTSGNTGIGLAMVAAARGYRAVIIMPEHASKERIRLLRAFGAEVILTPEAEGMSGAVRRAEELARELPRVFLPMQFKNPANPAAHRRSTALEILEQTGGRLDAFVASAGTGGTITGTGQSLKEQIPGIRGWLSPRGRRCCPVGPPASTRFRAWGRALSPRYWTGRCSTRSCR